MEKSRSLELLNLYLRDCSNLTEKLLYKALFQNKLSKEENDLAKEISHVANVMSAIYFYRQEKDLEKVLEKIPDEQKKVMEATFRIIWKHLQRMSDNELADLAIETIQTCTDLSEKIYSTIL